MKPTLHSSILLAGLLCWLAAPLAQAVTCQGGITASNPDDAYTVNPDGTVTDTRSGLIWDRCAWGQTGNDCSGGGASTHTWAGALAVAATANGSSWKGHADWRLPNIKELESLTEECRINPAINDTVFPNTPSWVFWSGSPYAFGSYGAWYVPFGSGGAGNNFRDNGYHVRLVRGGQSFDTFDATQDYTPDALGDYPPASNSAGAVTPAASGKTLSGLTTVTGIKIEGEGSPQYRVHDGTAWGAWTSATGAVKNGDQVEVRLTAGAAGSVRAATLTVGGMTAGFQVSEMTDGTCGTANGVATLAAPTTGLCSAGTPSVVTSLNGQHAWSCQGSGGGATVQCGATGLDASPFNGGASGSVALAVTGGGCSVQSASLATPTGLPAGVSLPYGTLAFELTGCSGGTATVAISYSGAVTGMTYWKQLGGNWVALPDTVATLSGNTVTLTLVDGGPYDADGQVDGNISDPGGPGTLADSNGGTLAPIPVLGPLGLMLLSGLLAWLGFAARRR